MDAYNTQKTPAAYSKGPLWIVQLGPISRATLGGGSTLLDLLSVSLSLLGLTIFHFSGYQRHLIFLNILDEGTEPQYLASPKALFASFEIHVAARD